MEYYKEFVGDLVNNILKANDYFYEFKYLNYLHKQIVYIRGVINQMREVIHGVTLEINS